jgi:uncharacterized repeat protein (TIGR03847 family)
MTVDFGTARVVDAVTFGAPGERTFQMRVVGAQGESASLWMEKQHLQALNLAFAQLTAQVDYSGQPVAPDMSDFPLAAEHDFKIGRLGLGFDPSDRTAVLDVYELTAEEEEEARLRVRLTPEQCAWLVTELSDIIAKGRPLCPLCGISIDPSGHACVRANGHSKQPVPDEQASEDDEGTV